MLNRDEACQRVRAFLDAHGAGHASFAPCRQVLVSPAESRGFSQVGVELPAGEVWTFLILWPDCDRLHLEVEQRDLLLCIDPQSGRIEVVAHP